MIRTDKNNLQTANNHKHIFVLHVDDDASVLDISKLMLQDINSGFEIDHACCVDEAFKKLSAKKYDVVVSDYEMPQKDGLQFLAELRTQNNETPFILFTGKGREEVAINALNLGADGYLNKQGSPETVYGELAHSIVHAVDRKKTKLALLESEKRYRNLMESASEAIFVHNLKGKIIDANMQACKNLGYSKEELLSMNASEVDVEAAEDKTGGDFWAAVLRGEPVKFQSMHRRKDQSVFPVEVSLSAVVIGEEIFVMAMVQDISQRKKNEQEIRQKYDVLERMGESVGAGLAIIGKDYSIIWANKALRDTIVDGNKKCYQSFNHLEMVCPDCGVVKIFEQNVSFDAHEYKTVNSKGETVWIELRVTPLKDANGNVVAALELAVPITERKKTEQFLRESEEKFRKAFETLPDASYIGTMEDGVIIEVNDAFSHVWGYSKEECVGKTSVQLGLYAKGPPDRQRMLSELKSKGRFSNLEFDGKRKNGEVFPLLFSGTLFEMNGKKLIYGILKDTTECKKRKKKLKEENSGAPSNEQ